MYYERMGSMIKLRQDTEEIIICNSMRRRLEIRESKLLGFTYFRNVNIYDKSHYGFLKEIERLAKHYRI